MIDYSYEEIRKVVLEILSEDARDGDPSGQFQSLKQRIAQVLAEREPQQPSQSSYGFSSQSYGVGQTSGLSGHNGLLFMEVFWSLFRDGIITLGSSVGQPDFPWFRVTKFGQKMLSSEPLAFAGDSVFTAMLQERVPSIEAGTLTLAREAAQALEAGRTLSSCLSLAAALERAWGRLLQVIGPETQAGRTGTFRLVLEERAPSRQLSAFKSALEKHLEQNPTALPPGVRANLDTQLFGVAASIFAFLDAREASTLPDVRPPSREQCYVLLQLFVPCCETLYRLTDALAATRTTTL